MSLGNTFENDLMKLILQNTDIATIGDAGGLRGSVAAGSLYFSLHSADPGEAGDQSTSEVSYTGYGRVAVARSGAGFGVTNNDGSPVAEVAFGACTAGSATAMFAVLGAATSGAGKQLWRLVIGSRLGAGYGETTDNITIPGLTGVAVDDRIMFRAPPGFTLPTGITEGTVYWVKTVSGSVVTISTTQGGATLDITALGTVMAFKVTPIAITNGVTPKLTTATVVRID